MAKFGIYLILLIILVPSTYADSPENIPVYVTDINATENLDKYIISVENARGSRYILDLSHQSYYDLTDEQSVILQQPTMTWEDNRTLTDELTYNPNSNSYYWALINETNLLFNISIPSITPDVPLHHEFFFSNTNNASYLFLEYSTFQEAIILTDEVKNRVNISSLGVQLPISYTNMLVYDEVGIFIWDEALVTDIGKSYVIKYDNSNFQHLVTQSREFTSTIFDQRTDIYLVIEKNHVTVVNYTSLTNSEFDLNFSQESADKLNYEALIEIQIVSLILITSIKKEKR